MTEPDETVPEVCLGGAGGAAEAAAEVGFLGGAAAVGSQPPGARYLRWNVEKKTINWKSRA
jgi:hypothetical protein